MVFNIKLCNHRRNKMERGFRNKIVVFLVGITFIGSIFISQVTALTDYQLLRTFRSPEIGGGRNFGVSVDIDGDLIVIGERKGDPNGINDAGKAYIYNTTGHLLFDLTAPEPQLNALFGWSVAINGDRVVVGELDAEVDGEPYAGRAHIFSSTGVHIKTLTTPTPIEGVEFGTSVAIDGDIIIVGTYVRVGGGINGEDMRLSPAGTESLVYIYDREGNFQYTLESPGSTDPSAFGISCAIDGEIMVIGEDHATVGSVDDAGKAYIFSTNGTPLATLEPSIPRNWGVFGLAVAVHGDRVVVSEAWLDPGYIHIFDTNGNKIKTLTGNYGAGIAVGSEFIVAGVEDTVDGKIKAGRACIYDLNGDPIANLTSPNPQSYANFAAMGYFGSRILAIDEGTLVVGVPLEDVNFKIDAGSAYIFSESSWSDVTTSGDPPPRAYHEMTYDSESDVMIMTHGQYSWPDSFPEETWTYSANSNIWTNKTTSTKPRGVSGHAIAYDSKNDVVIMFGGGYRNDKSTSETWAYDYNSNTWENRTPLLSPPARIGHEMVYDVQSEKLILVGGGQDLLQGSLFYNDVWSYHYETNTWTNVTPALNPQARWYFSMVYDVNADRTILFGGSTVWDLNSPIPHQGFKNDTWAFDLESTNWTKLNPLNNPEPRGYTSAVYHNLRDVTILFGGWNEEQDSLFNDTWSYDYTTNNWDQMATNSPGERSHAAMAYDSESNLAVLFGGYTVPYVDFSNSIWVYGYPVPPSESSSTTSTQLFTSIPTSTTTSISTSTPIHLVISFTSFLCLVVITRKKKIK
ncbi:MAG: Kelch repeat-containing protein [Candidatus Hodarchaeales archaeon]